MNKSYLIVDKKILADLNTYFRPALESSLKQMKANGVDIRDVLATNITKVKFIELPKVA